MRDTREEQLIDDTSFHYGQNQSRAYHCSVNHLQDVNQLQDPNSYDDEEQANFKFVINS